MNSSHLIRLAVAAFLGIAPLALAPAVSAADVTVPSDETIKGFAYPESVAYDPVATVLYVGEFGVLEPAEKNGKAKINKLDLNGEVLAAGMSPAAGQVLNKAKGIWIEGTRP